MIGHRQRNRADIVENLNRASADSDIINLYRLDGTAQTHGNVSTLSNNLITPYGEVIDPVALLNEQVVDGERLGGN